MVLLGPNVVVGSSYGGALVSLCIRRGDWDGPTVLLAPATGTIARLVGLDLSDCLWSPSHTRVFIVHSEEDALVPFSGATLRERAHAFEYCRGVA